MRLACLVLGVLLAGPATAADCDAAGQVALNQCADAALETADTTLNTVYQQIIGRLAGDSDSAGLLRAAQRAWLDFRDRECAFAASAAAQGSIYPMIVVTCRTELTQQRTERLSGYLHCAEGDVACPVPAPLP